MHPPRRLRTVVDGAGFTPIEWVRFLALTLPLICYVTVLKIIRIVDLDARPGLLRFLDQLSSDVSGAIALGLAGLAALVLVGRGRRRSAVFVVLQVVVTAIALLQSAAHLLYQRTGSPLDLALVRAVWGTRHEVGGLLASETGAGFWSWLAVVVAVGVLGPAVAVRVFRRRGTVVALVAAERARRRRLVLRTGLLAGALVVFAAAPGLSATSFARDPLLNAALSPLEARAYAAAAAEPAEEPPLHTTLTRPGGSSGERRNVVMIYLESVRAISTTVHDPELATTPFLARLAQTSLVAENAYSIVPHTSKAITAAHCGTAPPLDMLVTEAKPRGINARCLPALLRDQGYGTAFFQSATEHYDSRADLVRELGFDTFVGVDDLAKDDHVEANYFGWEDDILLDPSRAWLRDQGSAPFLASYLTVTSHHDYQVPSTIDTRPLAEDEELNRYLNTIRYGDRFVSRLFQQYRDLGLYDNTIFVITADHGEGFGEHGLRQHDNTVYGEGVHVPMIIHDPRRTEPRRITHPVDHTALLPTVTDLLGYRINGGRYPTPSLLAPAGDRPVRIACYVDNRCLALVRGHEKYVFHFGQRPDEYFDLRADPGERTNLVKDRDPDEIVALRGELLRWRTGVRELTALVKS